MGKDSLSLVCTLASSYHAISASSSNLFVDALAQSVVYTLWSLIVLVAFLSVRRAVDTFSGHFRHPSMYAWSQYSQQNGTNQNSLPPSSKMNGQVNTQPVQRFDSTHVSENPNDLYSTSASFNYDHPTPGGSVDNNIHTPEIQDLFWQETYNDTTGHMLDDGFHDSTADDLNSISYTDQMMRSARNSLPSPESTNTATPDPSGHSQKPSMNSTLFTSPLSTPMQLKRPLTSLDTDMPEYHDSTSHLHTPAHSSSRITSPAIHISRHSRGDSPARSDFAGPRIAKKRSVSNLSQGEYFPDVSTINQSTMLAPPSSDIEQLTDEDEEQRSGIGPAQRSDQEISSLEDIKKQQAHEKTVVEVQTWLEQTDLDPAAAERRRARNLSKPDRIRSRSTGTRPQTATNPIFVTQDIPGPGCVIDEQSDYYYSSDSESVVSIDYGDTLPTVVPPREEIDVAPEEQEPLPKQFFRPRLWQDPYATRAPDDSVRYQPHTSDAAIREFMQKAKDSETASRAATWGTSRRRLSDGDKDSIAPGEFKFRHGSLTRQLSRRTRERVREVQHRAKEQLLKRSGSHQKKQSQQLSDYPQLEPVQSPEIIEERSSTESLKQARQASYSKPQSPSISAGLLGATNSLAAVGVSSTGLAIETDHHEGLIRRTIRRVRSRSDVNRSPKSPTGTPSFTSMISHQGGMPVPSLASPSQEMAITSPQHLSQPPTSHPVAISEKLTSQAASPVKMTLSPQPTHILPTLDGFKLQIRELNPRLEPYLVERIAHDQSRRYKRLVKNRVDHLDAVAKNGCSSGNLCPDLGGEAELLLARSGGPNTASSSAQFKVAAGVDSDNEGSAFDGIVTPAAFPEGIPLPPTKKLPARFECPLCFQVKSFQKPSDWTKHVHEDVQPFTCTFPNCSEPKSFKRKADWVRHENERHRHLEWWTCNINECTHKCYRKDNFVQHLVREHKRKEPKFKGRGGGNAKGRGKNSVSGFNHEEQEFWNLVDACRHEATHDSTSEPCKFCDNKCTSWKKLSVHVGKHMEQIAMPVLGLAQRRNVTKDTIISPVEPPPSRPIPYLSHEQTMVSDVHTVMSPHTQSGGSNYQSSSAGQSPAIANRPMGMMPNQQLFQSGYGMNSMRQTPVMTGAYTQGGFTSGPGYTAFMGPDNSGYGSYNGQQGVYNQAQLSPDQYGPRLQGMDANYVSMNSAFDSSPHQGYYSSPEVEQSYPFGMNIMQVNGNMAVGSQQIPTPVTSQSMNGNVFVYGGQQPNHNQQYPPY